MKYKIEELKDITDSREIMQSRPNGFSKYMTYIILALLVVVIIWSLLAHKQVSIKASGLVKPSDEITKVSSSIAGNVTSVSIKDGDTVKKGDNLLILNGDEYILQKNLLQKSKDDKEKELTAMKNLKKSVIDEKSCFELNDEIQNEYYKKFEIYLQNLKSNNNQNELVAEQKNEINEYISNLEQLKKGIEDEKNYFSEGDTFYYQYMDYEMAMKNYRSIIKTNEEKINKLNEERNNESITETIDSQIETLNESNNSTRQEMEKYKNTTLMNITNSITEKKSSLSQITTSNASGSYKEQYISSVESSISNMESSISEIDMNLETVQAKIDSTSIKAPCDGVISLTSEINVGNYVQGGTEIATVIPEDNNKFNVEVYIANQNLGEIKEGQDVVIEIGSLPGSEYGYIDSKLENISSDAKINQEEGVSYYTAECPINKTTLVNKNKEIVNIKNGMLAEVRIINREVSYFRYFLEKIDIIN